MKRYRIVVPFLVLVLLAAFALPALAQGPTIQPGGPFVPPGSQANLSAIMAFEEVEKELLKLEARSKGVMQLDIAGYSREGRPLYIAKLGTGPERMWIQGRIHGNEPYGNDVCLEVIKSLLSSDKKILDKLTFWIIPSYNPDGSERHWRGNAIGVDLNRNWYRTDAQAYSEPESKAFYAAWREFRPHYAIDIHHQGTYLVLDETGVPTNDMTTLSIGIPVDLSRLTPEISRTTRQMAVAGYDATEPLGYCNPTRYFYIDIVTAALSTMLLDNPGPDGTTAGWKTAAMFFENRGGIGSKSRGYIVKQSVVGVHGIIDAIVSGELASVDPERWEDIPDRTTWNFGVDDKWPDEWGAE
jgi:hypothetical protein